ncbi:MAG: transposase [Bacteroidales bacterium]|nr:transposase [Bacteroidales bacterium]
MSEEKFQDKYRIPSTRARWHSYDGGAYFITICTKDMEHYFGEIVDAKMNLTDVGKYADEQMKNVTIHYPYAEIPLWIVMPNHIHAIVIIRNNDDAAHSRDVARNISTTTKNEHMSSISPKRNTLSVVVRGMKSSITKFANEQSFSFAWQPLYYDHIIRDSNEMNHIAEYIENNIAQWDIERENNLNSNLFL